VRRRARWCWLVLPLLVVAAVHLGAQPTQAQERTQLDVVTKWKIANTALFAAFLGFLIWKYAPAFFNARSEAIQKAIEEATGLKIEAEFRYSEIDRKMARLPEEIRKLRAQEATERERDHQRFRHETEAGMAHIRHTAQAEIEGYRQEGMRRTRRRTADHALRFAERRIREGLGAHEPQESVEDFLHLVDRGKAG
jgi:F0F1-type ATP synthase membrane subunit b/b'